MAAQSIVGEKSLAFAKRIVPEGEERRDCDVEATSALRNKYRCQRVRRRKTICQHRSEGSR